MKRILITLFALAFLPCLSTAAGQEVTETPLELGPWRAWLDVPPHQPAAAEGETTATAEAEPSEAPSRELPFGLELSRVDGAYGAWIINGTERIEIPRVTLGTGAGAAAPDSDDPGGRALDPAAPEDEAPEVASAAGEVLLGLHMDHYDSRITARISSDGKRLDGTWEKRRGLDEWTRMPFHAVAGDQPRFPFVGDYGLPGLSRAELIELGYEGVFKEAEEQRWKVQFSSSEDPAVLELKRIEKGLLMGTFLTTTGDYRYLAGRLGVDGLRLSCFDGAHAFLFHARPQWPGLRGDFWSRDTWHETWTAEWSPHATLPSPYTQSSWVRGTSLAELTFPDLEGNVRSLADPEFAGKARVVQIFGSWCPNCHDEAPLLAELHKRFAPEGLSIVGLAFELTGDHERDAQQVVRYRDRYGIEFPLLLAGPADKTRATAALGALDRVRSFPTTIFMHADGSIAKIHTGFTGPGTGNEYNALKRDFIDTIESLLREKPVDDKPYWGWLESAPLTLREPFGATSLVFKRDRRKRVVERTVHGREGPGEPEILPVELHYDAVRFGDELWAIDRGARVLRDPFDFGRRYSPDPESFTPTLGKHEIALEEDALVAALEHEDLHIRHEALFALAQLRASKSERGLPEALEWLEEGADPRLQVLTAWAMGRTFERRSADALIRCLDHPYAPLRREAARSLARMSAHLDGLRGQLAERPIDPDPLVRQAIEAALR